MKKYYKDMDIARGIGIFLVVLGHSFPDNKFNNNAFYAYIYKFIYSFHMPLFFMMSGFFAYKIYSILSSTQYFEFIYSKFRRVMIPYFAVSAIAIPIKLYMNKYAARPISLNGLVVNILFYPLDIPIQYFWFIYTLFFIFAVAPFLNRVPIKIVLAVTGVITLMPIQQVRLFYIYGIIHYLFYFFLGIYINTIYEKYSLLKCRKVIILVLLIILIVLNLFDVRSQMYTYWNFITALTGSMLCINISYLIVNNKIGELFKYIGKYSYDIYLFSWFFQTGTRVILFQMLHLNYTLVTIIMCLVGFMPIALSKLILNKIPILNKVLLGNK